jgi:[histone H3]-dimethyl-L-lysine9 demethylase
MSDIIKVAVDFVSPENVDRCVKLTKEFQEVNTSKAWKEDVLQLYSMLWFAWQSCSLQERKDSEDKESEVNAEQ